MSALAVHLWTSTIVLAVFLVLARVLPLTARTRYVLLLCGLLKFAIPEAALSAPLRALGFDAARIGSNAPSVINIQWLGPPQTLQQFAPSSPASSWPSALVIFWIATAALLAAVWIVARQRLVSSALKAATPASQREQDSLAAARRDLNLRTGVDIVRSGLCEAPAVVRIIRPTVVLPGGGCDALDDDELRSLLRHECAHVARRDNLLGLIESAIVAAFWFHPLVWIAQRSIATAREEACDEIAATSTPETIEAYVSALSKICRSVLATPLPGVSCMASAHLKERLNHLMRYDTLFTRAIAHRSVVALAAVAVLSVTLASGVRASSTPENTPFVLKSWVRPVASERALEFNGVVLDAKTGTVVLSPSVTFRRGTTAMIQSVAEPRSFWFDLSDGGSEVHITMRIAENGAEVQRSTYGVKAADFRPARGEKRYTGEAISIDLKNADIKDVLNVFGKLVGLEMRYPADLQGAVNLSVAEMPWDQALDQLLNENNLRYELNGKVMVIKRR